MKAVFRNVKLNAAFIVSIAVLLASFESGALEANSPATSASGSLFAYTNLVAWCIVPFDAKDTAKWLREFAGNVRLVELKGDETLDALDQAQSRSVQGDRVYDYAHALAAIKCGADVVLTRNLRHFDGLTGTACVEWS